MDQLNPKVSPHDQPVDDSVALSAANKPIPISKEEKERLLASYRLTLRIAGRGCIKLEDM